MAGVSKVAAATAATDEEQIVMVNKADIHPATNQFGGGSTSYASSSYSESQGSRFRLHRRTPYQRTPRDHPLVYQPATRSPRLPVHPPPSPPSRVLNPWMLRLLFVKELQNSDVSANGRIILPKREAEFHLPVLEDKDGLWMHLDDMDFTHVWTFRFRFWPNNTSRMYLFDNTRSLIEGHNLAVGDSIFLFKDEEHGSYVLRAKRDPMRVITHPTTESTIILTPRPPFNPSQVFPAATNPVTEDYQRRWNNLRVDVGTVYANPSNLQDVRAAEMSAVPVLGGHHQTTEMVENNVNVNTDASTAVYFPALDHQTTETTGHENINVANMDAIAFPIWNVNDQPLTPPLFSIDSGISFDFNPPMDDFFGFLMEQMEPVYLRRSSPSINFEAINFSIFG